MKLKGLLLVTLFTVVFWVSLVLGCLAQTITESYVTLKSGIKIGYGLFEPKEPVKAALIQMHGQGEFPTGVDYSHAALKVHGAYKYAFERKLDWFPMYVIAIQGKKNVKYHNAPDLDEAYELIKSKHNLSIDEIHLTGISQGGQAIGDLIKLNPKKYQIASTFSGVCTILWDGNAKQQKALYIWHNANDGVVRYENNERWHNWVTGFGGHSTFILNPNGGHSGWNTQYSKTSQTDLTNIYNWHLLNSKYADVKPIESDAPVAEIPEPIKEEPIPEPIPAIKGKLTLTKEMFSTSDGVNITKIVDAILKGNEPEINWSNQKTFSIKIDLGAEYLIDYINLKDGQGVPSSLISIKNDSGISIGQFKGDKYNVWSKLTLTNFKTRYIYIDNIQENKKNLPIGVEVYIK